jgi:hypothetical protein
MKLYRQAYSGGRADGEGETTADQQYIFTEGQDLSQPIGFPLKRDAANGGVGPGNKCLTNQDGTLIVADCAPPQLAPNQLFLVQ